MAYSKKHLLNLQLKLDIRVLTILMDQRELVFQGLIALFQMELDNHLQFLT